jgi:hypothetical protein
VGGTHALAAAGSARARVAGARLGCARWAARARAGWDGAGRARRLPGEGAAGPWGQRGGPPRWAREKKMLGVFFYAPLLYFIYFFSSLSI